MNATYSAFEPYTLRSGGRRILIVVLAPKHT